MTNRIPPRRAEAILIAWRPVELGAACDGEACGVGVHRESKSCGEHARLFRRRVGQERRPWRVASPANVTCLPRRLARHPSAHSSDSDLDSLNAGTRDRLWLTLTALSPCMGSKDNICGRLPAVKYDACAAPPLFCSSSICFLFLLSGRPGVHRRERHKGEKTRKRIPPLQPPPP